MTYVGFMTVSASKGLFYSSDASGSGSAATSFIELPNGSNIPARLNQDHWRPSLGELSFAHDATTSALTTVSTSITVPQGLVGIPGKFHGGFRALLATVFAREAAGHFGIDPGDLIKAVHNFKDSDFDGGKLYLSVEKNRIGSLVFSIHDDGGDVSQSIITPKSSLRAIDPPSRIDISNFKPTHQLGCIGSCAVASPFPKQGLGLDYSFDKNSGALMAAMPAHITDIHSRLGFILAGSDDMAWFSGFFKSKGKSGTTAGIDIITFNANILNQADLFIHVTAGESGPSEIVPVTAHIVNRFGLVAAKAEFKYIPEANPLAENSVAKRLGRQFEADLRHCDQVHVTRNLTAYYEILGPDHFHELMRNIGITNDALPPTLRRPSGYAASCFGVAGIERGYYQLLEHPFMKQANPYLALSKSADRFTNGVAGGLKSALGMGVYELLSGKELNGFEILKNSISMLGIGGLASSLIQPKGIFGHMGHSLLTIGAGHLLEGNFSFSKEEVMATLAGMVFGSGLEGLFSSGLGLTGKTFANFLRMAPTLGQAINTSFSYIGLGAVVSTLGFFAGDLGSRSVATLLGMPSPTSHPQSALIA